MSNPNYNPIREKLIAHSMEAFFCAFPEFADLDPNDTELEFYLDTIKDIFFQGFWHGYKLHNNESLHAIKTIKK